MEGTFYRGSAVEQTTRFSDKEKKLLKEMKFEKQLETEVCCFPSQLSFYHIWICRFLGRRQEN